MAPKGPYKLCTVNKVPERAKLIVGRFIESVKDSYIIDHAENAASMFALSLLQVACDQRGIGVFEYHDRS